MVRRAGGPAQLRVETFRVPSPGTGEVLVRNEAVGVAFADVLLREGLYPGRRPPVVPGYEIVGRVAATGASCGDFAPGDYVAALTVVGGYASDVVVPVRDLVRVPDALAPEKAAALVLNGVTAYQLLERSVPAGIESIAVFGAAGGVGSVLLDLARHRGVKTYGFAAKTKHATIEAKGAHPLERTDAVAALHAVAPNGVDAVFDGVGAANAARSFRMLAPGGTLVLFGAQGMLRDGRRNIARLAAEFAGMPRWTPLSLLAAGRTVAGYSIEAYKIARPQRYRDDLAAVFALASTGAIDPPIDGVLDLARAPEAHERLGAGRALGKIVLRTPRRAP